MVVAIWDRLSVILRIALHTEVTQKDGYFCKPKAVLIQDEKEIRDSGQNGINTDKLNSGTPTLQYCATST
jgi:hypothetical protein